MNRGSEDALRFVIRKLDLRVGVKMTRAFYYMTRNISERISLDDIADHIGMSKFSLSRIFSNQLLIPPFEWLWRFRMSLAHELLQLPLKWDIQQIAFKCGFTSPAHFSRAFKKVYGITPGRYRRMIEQRHLYGQFVEHPRLDGLGCSVMRKAFEKIMRELTHST